MLIYLTKDLIFLSWLTEFGWVVMKLLKDKNITVDNLMLWGFCGTFFFIPIATSPAVIVGTITLALWLFSGRFIKDRQKWFNQSWTKPVVVFMLLPWIGLLWTNDIQMGVDIAQKSYYWFYAFAIASLSYQTYTSKVFVNSFLVGLTVSVIITFLQYTGFVPRPKGCISGFMGHITFSLLLVFGLLLLSYYYKTNPNKKQRLHIIGLMIAFFFSLSIGIGRIGHLAFIILSPLIFYNIFRGKHFFKSAILVVLGAMITGVVLFLTPTVKNRINDAISNINSYEEGNKNTSVGLRLYMWDGAIKIFLQNPILGVGTGGYQKALRKYKDDPTLPDCSQPHNSFLYMAVSFGIIGLFSLLWLFLVFLKKGWQVRHTIAGFTILSFGFVLLIGSLTDTQILSSATGKMFALLTGIKTEQQCRLNEM